MNVFGNSSKQLLQALTANAEKETMDYVPSGDAGQSWGKRCRKRMRCGPICKILTSPRSSAQRSRSWAMDKLLECAEVNLRTLCDLIRLSTAEGGRGGSTPWRSFLYLVRPGDVCDIQEEDAD